MENYQAYKPIILFCILVAFFAYLIIVPPVGEEGKLPILVQKKIIISFSTIMLVLTFYGFYSVFKDTLQYVEYGKASLHKDKCVVTHITSTPIFFFAKKDIYCKSGKQFHIFFTFDNFFKDEVFDFSYLPYSRNIVEQRLISSPYKKREKF